MGNAVKIPAAIKRFQDVPCSAPVKTTSPKWSRAERRADYSP